MPLNANSDGCLDFVVLTLLDFDWVEAPLWQVIEDHLASIEKDAGAPDS